MIGKLLQSLFPALKDHLPDGRLASRFCGDLGLSERIIVELHLALCRSCRWRRDDLEGRRAENILEFYRDAARGRGLRIPEDQRAEFAQKLGERIRSLALTEAEPHGAGRFAYRRSLWMRPLLAASLLCAVAAPVSLRIWQIHKTPALTSNALLDRAGQWDTANLRQATGVVYQSVRISSPELTMGREIYRDPQRKRRQRVAAPINGQQRLEEVLTEAGVDWDEPISAIGYRQWRGTQSGATDSISRPGEHLLKLTTSVTGSPVLSESLTVRDTDFHPVLRTVDLRGAGTVEIAELDFKILPWSAVSDGIFMPLTTPASAMTTDHSHLLEAPKLPRLLTPLQLDEAELSARLALNQIHADGGEQIEIERGPQEIVIRGVVDTDERKRELQKQIALLPHVRLAIQSSAELRFAPPSESVLPSHFATMPNQSSALELYLRRRGRSIEQSNRIAQQLANAALEISQESRAITDLQARFQPAEKRSILAEATLSNLLHTHRERLRAALQEERSILAQAQGADAASLQRQHPEAASLPVETSRNLSLLKELTQTEHPPEHSAEEILGDMSTCVDDMSIAANHVFGRSENAAALGGER